MKQKFHFSKIEVKHILLALFVLALSFQFVLFKKEIFADGLLMDFFAMLKFFLQALVIVGLAFVLHELGHKYVAQKKGLWAEFRAWPVGLLFALAMAIFSRGSFLFAAPGAVMIVPARKTKNGFIYVPKMLKAKDIGLIGAAGPLVNIILAAIFSLLALALAPKVFAIAAQTNAWFAIFNMIPFGLLDGQKIWRWSKPIWLGIFALSLLLFSLTVLL